MLYVRNWCKYSLKSHVSEESDRQEDGRNSTANVCDKGKDGGLERSCRRFGESL